MDIVGRDALVKASSEVNVADLGEAIAELEADGHVTTSATLGSATACQANGGFIRHVRSARP